MAQIERGFVTIQEGQVHFRRSVQRQDGRIIWMVHASPASSVSVVPLMRALGDHRTCIAPDTLGNGDSAPPSVATPDIAWYAESSLRVMDAMGIAQADLYGSHTGAHIVMEMAIQQPHRFGRVVLDGIPMFSPDEKTDYITNYAPAITPDFFGSQFHWAWHFVRDQGWFFPYFKRDTAHLRGIDAPSVAALHDITVEVLKSIKTYHLAYRAAFAHADRERLALVPIPTLVTADNTDPLQAAIALAPQILPGCQSTLVKDSASAAGRAAKIAMLLNFYNTGRLVE
jgi:pimeloyl-ACP methyl ester carboxylesterase